MQAPIIQKEGLVAKIRRNNSILNTTDKSKVFVEDSSQLANDIRKTANNIEYSYGLKVLPKDRGGFGSLGNTDMNSKYWTIKPFIKDKTAPDILSENEALGGNFQKITFLDGLDGVELSNDNNVFCQLSDNILSKRCKDEITVSQTIKEAALKRICNKVPGDKIDIFNTSDNYYFRNSGCSQFCDNPFNNNKCDKGRSEYCSKEQLDAWPSNASMCKSVWGRNFNKEGAENSCGNLLIDGLSDQNIFTDNGCGKLCKSKGNSFRKDEDVNHEWCNKKYGEFCSKDKFNMFTQDCYDFCKEHPIYCEDSLKNMCSSESSIGKPIDENLTREEAEVIDQRMRMRIPGTDKTWGDWCGCHQSSQFYNIWRDKQYEDFLKAGIDINVAFPNLSPACVYDECKGDQIQTYSQTQEQCPRCVQILPFLIGESSTVGDITPTQVMECKETYNLNVENTNTTDTDTNTDIDVDEDTTYIDNSQQIDENKGVLNWFEENKNWSWVVIVGPVFFIIIVLIIYFKK